MVVFPEGLILKDLIRSSGVSQRHIAKLAGVNETALSQVVNGSRKSWPILKAVAKELKVSLDVFDQASDNMAEDSLASYGKKGLISIDVSHFEEQLKSMKSEMKIMQKEISFLRELILQQKESDKVVKEELTTG